MIYNKRDLYEFDTSIRKLLDKKLTKEMNVPHYCPTFLW